MTYETRRALVDQFHRGLAPVRSCAGALERVTTLLQRFADSGVSRTLLADVPDDALPPLIDHLGHCSDLD
jgi:hypothetical protein